jgi:membrane protease YdiL (CAAX protease family)
MIFVALPIQGVQELAKALRESNDWPESDGLKLATNILAIFCGFLSYIIYARLFEWRWPKEIALRGFLPEFSKGLGLGALLFSATILILWIGGFWTIEGTNSLWVTATAFGISLAGFFEELLVRGVLYRILEESLGTWIALVLSAAFFGFVHMANPNATLGAGIALALEAGLLLAAAYSLTGRLWFATGLHVAWNYTQGGIFGLPISGNEMTGMLSGKVSGPVWISGGEFGVEASWIAVAVCLIATSLILRLVVKRSLVKQPFWKRKSVGVDGNLPALATSEL